MLPHDKHTCTFRIVYTLYVCNKRINTQLQSMWILNKPWWKEQNIGIPECGRERCGKIFDYASSKIFATSPFASKIFASPTLCVYPFLSLLLMLKIVINVSTYKSVILNLRKPQSIKYFPMKSIAESNLLSWFGNILFGSRIKNDLCFWSVYCEPIQYFLKHGGSALMLQLQSTLQK